MAEKGADTGTHGSDKRGLGFVGLTTVALSLVGLASFLLGLGAATQYDWVGCGLCFLASAVAFGLLLGALLK